MATNNAINNMSNPLASSAITVDPGASGDSYVQFDINGTGEFRIGVDDNAADAFKISQGSALGSNDTFVMTANGECTLPLQPAFLGVVESTANNVTGDNTYYTISSYTEVFDQSGDFNHTTGIFTAPISGIYYVGCAVVVTDLTASMTFGSLALLITGLASYVYLNPYAIQDGTGNRASLRRYEVIDVDAADTVQFRIGVGNDTKTADVFGSGTGRHTYFFGNLIV
jgi:hypothetical protein